MPADTQVSLKLYTAYITFLILIPCEFRGKNGSPKEQLHELDFSVI